MNKINNTLKSFLVLTMFSFLVGNVNANTIDDVYMNTVRPVEGADISKFTSLQEAQSLLSEIDVAINAFSSAIADSEDRSSKKTLSKLVKKREALIKMMEDRETARIAEEREEAEREALEAARIAAEREAAVIAETVEDMLAITETTEQQREEEASRRFSVLRRVTGFFGRSSQSDEITESEQDADEGQEEVPVVDTVETPVVDTPKVDSLDGAIDTAFEGMGRRAACAILKPIAVVGGLTIAVVAGSVADKKLNDGKGLEAMKRAYRSLQDKLSRAKNSSRAQDISQKARAFAGRIKGFSFPKKKQA